MAVSLRSNQALQASTLIGRSVFVPSARLVVNNDDCVSILLFAEHACNQAVVYLENDLGDIVLEKPVGELKAGDNHLVIRPGKDCNAQLKNGPYLIRAEAAQDNNKLIIPTYIKAVVASVKLSGEHHEPVLNLKNDQAIELSKVRIIL